MASTSNPGPEFDWSEDEEDAAIDLTPELQQEFEKLSAEGHFVPIDQNPPVYYLHRYMFRKTLEKLIKDRTINENLNSFLSATDGDAKRLAKLNSDNELIHYLEECQSVGAQRLVSRVNLLIESLDDADENKLKENLKFLEEEQKEFGEKARYYQELKKKYLPPPRESKEAQIAPPPPAETELQTTASEAQIITVDPEAETTPAETQPENKAANPQTMLSLLISLIMLPFTYAFNQFQKLFRGNN